MTESSLIPWSEVPIRVKAPVLPQRLGNRDTVSFSVCVAFYVWWGQGQGRDGAEGLKHILLTALKALLCCAQSPSHVQLFVTPPWTAAHQTPLSMGILQVGILERVDMPSSRGSSQPRGQTQVSCIAGGFFTTSASKEALGSPKSRQTN